MTAYIWIENPLYTPSWIFKKAVKYFWRFCCGSHWLIIEVPENIAESILQYLRKSGYLAYISLFPDKIIYSGDDEDDDFWDEEEEDDWEECWETDEWEEYGDEYEW